MTTPTFSMAESEDILPSGGSMKKLPSSTVRLIGSTQVITSPLSAVKELVENSLDAGGTSIDIKLENYGIDKIEVRDNGTGIECKDTEFMGQSHYTSKISTHSDLEGLVTYGFRGEALGSLCAVSDVTITTKTVVDTIGFTYRLDHKGQIKNKTPSHLGQGTTVQSTNLFKDLPVRRQFYNSTKKKKEILKTIEDLVMSFGVIHPEIRLTLRHNKESLWQKNIVSNHRMALLNVLGSATLNQLQYVDYHDEGLDIEAYLPSPTSNVQMTGKTQTDRTFIFVNSRPVINKDIEKRLKKYYTAGLHCDTARYPVGFLSLEVTPGRGGLDVNLDPNKTQVMFHQKENILEAIEKLLSDLYGDLEDSSRSKGQSAQRKQDIENNNDKERDVERVNLDTDSVDFGLGAVEAVDVCVQGDPMDSVENFSENKLEFDNRKLERNLELFEPSCSKSGTSESVAVHQSEIIENVDSLLEDQLVSRLGMISECEDLGQVGRELYGKDLEGDQDSCAKSNGADFRNVLKKTENSVSDSGPSVQYPTTRNRNCHQMAASNRGFDILEDDFNEIFEHPLLQDFNETPDLLDMSRTDSSAGQGTGLRSDSLNSDIVTEQKTNSSEATSAKGDVQSLDNDFQPGLDSQLKILSGGYEVGQRIMGPKRDDLSLLGQRRISTTSESEASRDSATPARNFGETLEFKMFTALQTVGDGGDQGKSVDAGEESGRRLSLTDLWSKGTGLLDQTGKTVEPVKLLTARPSISTPQNKSFNSEKLNRSVNKKMTAELSAGQTTLQESMTIPLIKPKTAFELFVKDHKEKVIDENPDADIFEMKVILRQKWDNYNSPEKKPYEEMEIKGRERYWSEMVADQKSKKEEARKEFAKEQEPTRKSPAKRHPSKKRKIEKAEVDASEPRQREGITVAFSLSELKEKHNEGVQDTQSQPPSGRPDLLCPIKSLGGMWTYCHDSKLSLLNHWRAQEVILFRTMMENHVIPHQHLEKPVKLDQSSLDQSCLDVLDRLHMVQHLPDPNYYIEDERLVNNGFRVRKIATTDTYEIVGMSACMSFYGVSDLREILSHIQQDPDVSIAHSRPLKILNYLKSEAVRLSRQMSSSIPRLEIEDILEKLWTVLPHDSDCCLHGKPIVVDLYDLDQVPETQYTQE